MKLTHITTIADFKALKDEWEELHEKSSNESIFMTWEWLYSWWEVFKDKHELWLLILRNKENRLVGAAPLYLANDRSALLLPKRELRFVGVGSPVSPEHLDIIAVEGYEEVVVQSVGEYLSEKFEFWDDFLLSDVTDEQALAFDLVKHLQIKGAKGFNKEQKPHTSYISLPDSWEAYVKGLSRSMRKNINQHRKKLFEQSDAYFEVWTGEKDSFEKAFEEFARLFIARKISVGLSNKFKEKGYAEFHKLVAKRFSERGWLHLSFIRVKEEALAAIYCFKYRGIIYDYQSGFKPEMKSHQLMSVLRSCVIEQAISEGVKEFDYLRGDESYKFRWSAKIRKKFLLKCYNPSLYGKTLHELSKGKKMIKNMVARVQPKEAMHNV